MAAPDINIVGFETGDGHEFHSSGASGTWSVQSSIKRTGNYALRTNPTTTGNGRIAIGTHDSQGQPTTFNAATAYYRYYIYVATAPASNDEDTFTPTDSASNVKMYVRLHSSRVLKIYDGAGTPSLMATGTVALSLTTWYRIEVKCGTGAVSGAWEVKLFLEDSTTALETLSGTGNLLSGNNGLGFFGKVLDHNAQTVDFYYDDIAISSTGYPGPGKHLMFVPTSDGTYTTWIIGAGSGSKYQQIDEVPHDGDTTYLLSTLVDGDAYTGTFDATAGVTGTVNAVKEAMIVKRDGGSNSIIQVRFRSGSTNSDAVIVAAGSVYDTIPLNRIFTTDPNTSSAWSISNMTALEAGPVGKDTSNQTRLTAVYLMVDFTPPPDVIPGTASLIITTFAPTVTTPLIPSTATLQLITYAPTVNIVAPSPVVTGALLQIDWNDDGDFNDTGEDVTPRLIDPIDVTCVRGKDQLRLLSPPMAGAFTCELDNRSRDYSVDNTSSPIYSHLHPGHKLRLHLLANATDYSIFTGVLDGLPQHPEFGRWSVEAPALGSLSRLRGKKISTELFEGIKSGAAINAILDAVGWHPLERVIDLGQTTYNQFWVEGQDAFDAISEVLLTEGPGASIYEDARGFFIFEDRHYRTVTPRCTSSQFTFTDQDYVNREGFEYDQGIDDIINECEVSVTTRSTKDETFIWQYGKPLVLSGNETRVIRAEFSNPAKNIQIPSASSGINAVQRLKIIGTAPQIRLSFRDEQTPDIGSTSGGPTAALIQTRLEGLSSIGAGNVTVVRSAVAPDFLQFDITFINDLGHQPVELLGLSVVSLSGKAIEGKIVDLVIGKLDDYRLLAGALTGLSLDRTSGQSVTITITADAAGAYVDGLQLRGQLVSVDSEKRIVNLLDASVSQGLYGLRSYQPGIRQEISEEEALQLADNIVRYYQDPRAILVFWVAGIDGTIQLQQLGREISDRITIQDAQTGINAEFFIERIGHRITKGPRLYTQFGCEKVGNLPPVSGGSGSLWDSAIWDSAIWGS